MDYFFPYVLVLYVFEQKPVGLHFGRLLKKLIWSSWSKLKGNFYRGKCGPKIWATSAI
jgi:hypothetical protein